MTGPTDGFTTQSDRMYEGAHAWRGVADALVATRMSALSGVDEQAIFGPVARASGVAAKHQEFASGLVDLLQTARETMVRIAGGLEQTAATYDAADRGATGAVRRTGG